MFDADTAATFRRTVAAAIDRSDPVKARAVMIDAGWLDALEADKAMAVAIVFREQGRTNRDGAALDDVLAGELGIGEVAVAYPGAPGQRVVLPAHRHATRLLWVPDHARDELTVIDLDTALDAPTVRGIDPAAGLLGLHERPAGILTELPGSAWPSALAAGRVALAHQLTGGARALLEMAVAHARHRTQFGVPLTAFQAVKHRLSDVLVAISAAESATVAAATAGTPASAEVAKAMAGRAAAIAGRNCLQVFGGIGFTAEHDFHSYYRRSLVLDRLLGDRRTLERELGAQLRAGALANERIANLDDAPCVDLHSPGFGSP